MEVKTVIDGPEALVQVAGEIDASTAPTLGEALEAAIDQDMRTVVVDAAGITFIDSSGLSVLVAAHKRLKAGGGELVVASASAPVRRLLGISGLDRVLTVRD
ncbi:MAG: anti-sigma factor antagonist [Actinomycetota bacterium]|nr:anti-sigma factor antagonist [Actinomycetota bacterium]